MSYESALGSYIAKDTNSIDDPDKKNTYEHYDYENRICYRDEDNDGYGDWIVTRSKKFFLLQIFINTWLEVDMLLNN